MSENGNESKKYKYLVTMRWYVETDEALVAGAAETDEKLLDIVRHRKDGSKSCSTCPTNFMGDKKPVYMSTEQIKD